MAKKKHKKKHNFQHKNAPSVATPVATPAAVSASKTSGKPTTMPNEWSEVAADVRRSLVLAGIFIALMIAFWYFLDVSEFGKNIYKSITL
jgi:ribose/xylose/arabinose/galactoside ABC-type transport system permease subunit